MATQNIDPGSSNSRIKDVEGVGTKSKDNHSVSKRFVMFHSVVLQFWLSQGLASTKFKLVMLCIVGVD